MTKMAWTRKRVSKIEEDFSICFKQTVNVDAHSSADDLESGPNQGEHTPPVGRSRPLTTSIIPVYRR